MICSIFSLFIIYQSNSLMRHRKQVALMKTVLQLNTSIFSGNGQSSQLANEFVAQLDASKVVVRDLASEPVPHLDAERFGAFLSKPDTRTREQQAVVDYSDKLNDELRQ